MLSAGEHRRVCIGVATSAQGCANSRPHGVTRDVVLMLTCLQRRPPGDLFRECCAHAPHRRGNPPAIALLTNQRIRLQLPSPSSPPGPL